MTRGPFFNRDAAGGFVMNDVLEFFSQRARVLGGDAGDQNPLLAFEKFRGNLQDLLGRFARAENDFGKTFAQSAMHVHLREAEVGDRRGLEGAQNLVAADAAGAKLFEESDSFRRGHGGRMPQKRWNPSFIFPIEQAGEGV